MDQKKPFTFYAQNIQTKSFYDEKAQKQRYMVGGYISTGDLDLVNDIATEGCRKDLSAQFKGHTIKLDYDHETIRADKMQSEFDSRLNLTKPVLGKAVSEENDGIGNMVWFELNKNWKKFDPQGNITMDFKSVWEDIENGYYDAFSIAYVPVKTRMLMKGDAQVRLLDKVNLINVALTGNPVNPAARMMDFSAVMAKSLEYMKEKEDNTMEAELKSRVDALEEELAEMKAKYTRRWRGNDGKWHYEYGKPSSGRSGAGSSKEPQDSGREELTEADTNKLYDEATNEILDGNTNPEKIADNLEKIRNIDADRETLVEIAKDAIESEKQIAKENPEASPLSEKKPNTDTKKPTNKQGITMSQDPDVSAEELAKKFSNEQLKEISESVMANKQKVTQARLLQEKKPKWKSHSQEPNGGIMMENENEAKPEAKAEPQVKPQAEPQAKPEAKAKAYEDEESESEEDKEDKKEGKSQEFDAKSFAEMKSIVADLKSKVEELEKANKDMKSVLEEARPAGNGAENEATKQAKSQADNAQSSPLNLIKKGDREMIADQRYATSFGSTPNETRYYTPSVRGIDGKSMTEESDLRPKFKEFMSKGMQTVQAKALDTSAGGAGTAGTSALVPVYVDPRIVDQSRKYTPLVEMLPRVTNMGLTADYNVITAKGAAFTTNPDAALAENDDTEDRKSKSIKYLYSVGRVLGQMQQAMPSYILEGMNPTGAGNTGGSVFNTAQAPNAKQYQVLLKARALKELEENLILNGDSSSDPTEFDGLITIQSTTNQLDKSTTALTLDDIEDAIRYAFDDGGRPKLGVASSSVLTDVRKLIVDAYNYRPADFMSTETLPVGVPPMLHIETMVGTIPLIPSQYLSNVSGSKQLWFFDTDFIEVRVLQDMTYENLAKTNDSDKFMLKIYECVINRAPQFSSYIDNIL